MEISFTWLRFCLAMNFDRNGIRNTYVCCRFCRPECFHWVPIDPDTPRMCNHWRALCCHDCGHDRGGGVGGAGGGGCCAVCYRRSLPVISLWGVEKSKGQQSKICLRCRKIWQNFVGSHDTGHIHSRRGWQKIPSILWHTHESVLVKSIAIGIADW